MRTICLTLMYDGTSYSGWQVQPDRPSIQQAVERAIWELTGESVKVAASGRTDAGVHALGQLASFHTHLAIPVEAYRRGLVTHLPGDIVVREACEQPPGFHARFDAVRKTYRYVIHNARVPSPWLRNHVWWYRGPLDRAAMRAATEPLIGTHDFRCFETQWPNRSSSVRTVYSARWTTWETWPPWAEPSVPTADLEVRESAESPFLCFEITADGFLYNMVRAIVGTLVHVGRGRWNVADLERIVRDGDRRHAGDTAPAQGLYLLQVEVDVNHERIAARRARMQRDPAERGVEGLDSEGRSLADNHGSSGA